MSDPRFSVVVVTCNRPEVLARTLERLTAQRQRLARDLFEVIVADDSRTTATQELVKCRFPDAVYVRGPGRGPASNRNAGAAKASGEWLAFIDDDCQPVDGWLAVLRAEANAGTADVVEGPILVPDKCDSPFRRHVENLTGGNFWTGNLSIRRECFRKLGGFDEDFLEAGGEDLEFAERIRRSNLQTTFCSSLAVIHPSHVVSWRYLFWRTFLIRWHLLYLLKTGGSPPGGAPAWTALRFLAVSRTMGLLRLTWRSLRQPDRAAPWTMWFDLAHQWVMFPIVLPYLAYWELRFRRGPRAGVPR